MSDTLSRLNRRHFLKNASLTALAGTMGAGGISSSAQAPESSSHRRTNQQGSFDFDRIYDRFGTNSYKWDRQVDRFGAEHFDIGMGVADMDFPCPPAITEALIERCQHENWGYINNTDSLKEAIVQWNAERYGIEVDPATIEIAEGVHPGLIAALHALSPPGTRVLMNTPTYNGFYSDLEWTRTLVNDSEMWVDREGAYHIDWDDLEARMTPDCHAMLLCNPQNPTGNVWSEEDLMRIGELCLKNQVVVLADEIHCDFVMDGQKYTPFASLPDKDIVDNSLTFKAISKTFSLAGMKNAYFYSTNPILLDRVKWWHRASPNTLGIVANEAAYRHGQPWFDQLNAYIDGNHEHVAAYIRENIPKISYTKAQGTYLAWLDVSEAERAINAGYKAEQAGLESADHYFEQWLVMNAGVQLNPGANYGTGGLGHMRMNLGTPRPLIERALDRIAEAVNRV